MALLGSTATTSRTFGASAKAMRPVPAPTSTTVLRRPTDRRSRARNGSFPPVASTAAA